MTARKSPKSLLESAITKGRYVANGLEFLELPNVGDANDLVTIPCKNGEIMVVDLKNNILQFYTNKKDIAFNVLKNVKGAKLDFAHGVHTFFILFPLTSIHQVARIAGAERNPEC